MKHKVLLCFFPLLYGRENLALSLVLLIGCYSAILIPAYLPLDKVATLSDDSQHPKDLVRIHISAIILDQFFTLTFYLCLPSLFRSY